eukprot:3194717-Prymnesium_polylepis.1
MAGARRHRLKLIAGGGAMDFDEFCEVVKEAGLSHVPSQAELREQFAKHDADATGVIELYEVEGLLADLENLDSETNETVEGKLGALDQRVNELHTQVEGVEARISSKLDLLLAVVARGSSTTADEATLVECRAVRVPVEDVHAREINLDVR